MVFQECVKIEKHTRHEEDVSEDHIKGYPVCVNFTKDGTAISLML